MSPFLLFHSSFWGWVSFFLADLIWDMFLIPLNFSRTCCTASFLFALVLDPLAHLLQLLLVFSRDGPFFFDESFDVVVTAFCFFCFDLLLLLHSSILPQESSFLLFLFPSVLVLLPRLLRVHPTLLLFLRHLLQRVPLLVLLHFLSASVRLLRFLDTAFKFIISLVDRVSFLMLFFSIVLDHAALTHSFLSSQLQSDYSKVLFCPALWSQTSPSHVQLLMSPFGVMYVACFSVVFLYIVLTAQTSVASPIASFNLLSCFRHWEYIGKHCFAQGPMPRPNSALKSPPTIWVYFFDLVCFSIALYAFSTWWSAYPEWECTHSSTVQAGCWRLLTLR